MTVTMVERASILIQALPYIQQYIGKVIVVKYGGAAMANGSVREAVIEDLVLMSCVGIKVVVVHGGGPEITDTLRKMGKETSFVDGLRYTDEETMDVVQMVLAGKVNKQLVSLIGKKGGKGVGLCGMDGGLMTAKRYTPCDKDLGFVGEPDAINPELIEKALQSGYIPVVATVAPDKDWEPYNVNADTAAAAIAAALGAEKLVLLTDVPGIMRDIADSETLIRATNRSEVKELKKAGIIKGGMIPKVDCCLAALAGGVARAHIIDGRVPHSLLIEIFSDEGIGTMFTEVDDD
jgi:acetylglutamate kinase